MVKQGYKQTEIGVIPEEWKIASLKDLSDGRFTYGVNAPAIPYAPPLPNYIRITDISDDGRFMRESRTSVDCQNPEMYTLKENDIVFARTGASTGKTYLYRKNDGDLVYAGFLIKASILPEKANSKYVFDNLHTNRYWNWVSVTSMRSGQPGINGNEYASYMIPCPSLPEQEHIAEVLSDVDSMISSLEKLIAKKKTVKQGAMQELLTGKKRLPGFTGEWAHMELGKYGSLMKETINPQLYSSEYFWEYSMPAFDEGRTPIKQKGADMHSNRTVICGKVLLFNKLNVRQKRIWLIDQCRDNAVCSSEFLPYKSDAINLELLSQILYTDKVTLEFIGMSTGTSNSQKRITPDAFLEYKVYLPVNEKEQAAIANVFSCMDNEIEALEQKLAKTRQLKQGMMQQLLTGKIRLV